MKDIFDPLVTQEFIQRLHLLKPQTKPSWGKMDAGQMLAHCNVVYEMIYEDKHPKPNFLTKLILRSFVKKIVTNEIPYKQSSQTAPQFIMKGSKDFESEKQRLIDYVLQTQKLGGNHFHLKHSHSFGPLTTTEWNNMFYKHLDHHFRQFNV